MCANWTAINDYMFDYSLYIILLSFFLYHFLFNLTYFWYFLIFFVSYIWRDIFVH